MDPNAEQQIIKVLDRLPVAAVIASVETGTILWINARHLGLVGATDPAQVVGHSLLEFLAPDQHAIALRDIEAIVRGESPAPVTYRLNNKAGRSASVQISSVPMAFHGQRAMLSLVADVSSQERVIEELRDSEERYRNLVESIRAGLVVVVNGEVAYANPSLLEALGIPADESVVGTSIYDHIGPESRQSVRKALRGVLSTKNPHRDDEPTSVVRRDGTTFRTRTRTTFVHWRGEDATQTIMPDVPGR